MKILCWTLAHWTEGHEPQGNNHPITGLSAWVARMSTMIPHIGGFIASGTWSDPVKNPARFSYPVVNAGVPYLGSYDYHRRHYAKCAISAGLAYALNRNDWDLLVCMDTDAMFGNVDLNAIFRRFVQGEETTMAPGWWGKPGGPLWALKREGAYRLAHYRRTPNMLDDHDKSQPMNWESEVLSILGKKKWYNPFPDYPCLIHQRQPQAIDWPIIASYPADPMSEEFKKLYHETRSNLTKPVII